MDGARRRRIRRLADRAQPIQRAGQGELGRPEPVDEVAPPDPPGILHRPEDRVDGAEPAVDGLGRDRLAGHHAVPFEQATG